MWGLQNLGPARQIAKLNSIVHGESLQYLSFHLSTYSSLKLKSQACPLRERRGIEVLSVNTNT